VLGYLGVPVSLEGILLAGDSSFIRQAHDPRMMAKFLNLAGFGMAAWEPRSARAEEPFLYRVADVPTYDGNLRHLAHKLVPTCLIAHVRGMTWNVSEVPSPQNLHPFRFPGVNTFLAHNGHLRDFASMRYDLLPHIRPDFAERIAGTTDSEWIYAVLLSQLEDPHGMPAADDTADALGPTLGLQRDIRARRGIDTSSPVNLFVTTGECFVATRFSFDYGWYPEDDELLETDLPYVSLWYTLGDRYAEEDGEWMMRGADGPPRSMIVASEPLAGDPSSWLEAPEYSLIAVSRDGESLHVETHDLAA